MLLLHKAFFENKWFGWLWIDDVNCYYISVVLYRAWEQKGRSLITRFWNILPEVPLWVEHSLKFGENDASCAGYSIYLKIPLLPEKQPFFQSNEENNFMKENCDMSCF